MNQLLIFDPTQNIFVNQLLQFEQIQSKPSNLVSVQSDDIIAFNATRSGFVFAESNVYGTVLSIDQFFDVASNNAVYSNYSLFVYDGTQWDFINLIDYVSGYLLFGDQIVNQINHNGLLFNDNGTITSSEHILFNQLANVQLTTNLMYHNFDATNNNVLVQQNNIIKNIPLVIDLFHYDLDGILYC